MITQFLTIVVALSGPAAVGGGEGKAKRPVGLGKLGRPGGLPGLTDPEAIAFETEVLSVLNAFRANKGAAPLAMDEALRGFARQEAKAAAVGDPASKSVHERIKERRLGGVAYRLQYGWGRKAGLVLRDLRKDKAVAAALVGEFHRVGIGAFLVPAEKPYYQVALIVVREADPALGQTGLSRQQTDAVIAQVTPRLNKKCYEPALAKDPNARGEMLLGIEIGGSGRISSVKVLKSFGTLSFDACVVEMVKKVTFPVPLRGKPVSLKQPFRFVPPQGDRRIGRLSPSQVRGAFRMVQRQFKACYDERLNERPALRGSITLAVTVAPDGKPSSIQIEKDGLGDAQLGTCVLKQAQQVRFPRPEFGAPAEVSFAVEFEPPGS